jgi:hypothetical protein
MVETFKILNRNKNSQHFQKPINNHWNEQYLNWNVSILHCSCNLKVITSLISRSELVQKCHHVTWLLHANTKWVEFMLKLVHSEFDIIYSLYMYMQMTRWHFFTCSEHLSYTERLKYSICHHKVIKSLTSRFNRLQTCHRSSMSFDCKCWMRI